jgi:hypothetical protein
VSQVVHDYGDVCQSITELAVEINAPISTQALHHSPRLVAQAAAYALCVIEQTATRRTRHASGSKPPKL